MPRRKGSRNKKPNKPTPPLKSRGGLHKRYWDGVPNGMRRILYRPYAKRLYLITPTTVLACNPATWNKDALLRKGYVIATGTNRNQTILERIVVL